MGREDSTVQGFKGEYEVNLEFPGEWVGLTVSLPWENLTFCKTEILDSRTTHTCSIPFERYYL